MAALSQHSGGGSAQSSPQTRGNATVARVRATPRAGQHTQTGGKPEPLRGERAATDAKSLHSRCYLHGMMAVVSIRDAKSLHSRRYLHVMMAVVLWPLSQGG